MKNYSRILSFSVLACLLGQLSLRADTVVINYQKVFEEYIELKLEDQKLRDQVAAFQTEQQQKVQSLQQKQQEFNGIRNRAAQPEVPEAERKSIVEKATQQLEELNKLEQELRQERAQFQKDLEAKGLRLRRGIVEKVNAKIEELAEENDWELVLDSSAKSPNGLPMVSYASKTLDRTDLLIQELNAMFTKQTEAAE
ncbi:OmpH family outer membrane protein [Kiritimatiellaeota bacterium B1221]|nr:OmpH family outer membrane protein [Kiritimatiellaeota bacterium B1221]